MSARHYRQQDKMPFKGGTRVWNFKSGQIPIVVKVKGYGDYSILVTPTTESHTVKLQNDTWSFRWRSSSRKDGRKYRVSEAWQQSLDDVYAVDSVGRFQNIGTTSFARSILRRQAKLAAISADVAPVCLPPLYCENTPTLYSRIGCRSTDLVLISLPVLRRECERSCHSHTSFHTPVQKLSKFLASIRVPLTKIEQMI